MISFGLRKYVAATSPTAGPPTASNAATEREWTCRAAALASSVGQWAGNVDAVFDDSAAETGGVRHVRWATDASCNLVIQRVKLSTTGDDNFNNTMSELHSEIGSTSRDVERTLARP